jgi:hypothetical protein
VRLTELFFLENQYVDSFFFRWQKFFILLQGDWKTATDLCGQFGLKLVSFDKSDFGLLLGAIIKSKV